MMTQLVNQTLTMHCRLMQCAGVSTWVSKPLHSGSISNGIIQLDSHMAPRGELSQPFRPHPTDPRQINGYDAHLALPDNDTMSVGMPDIDMETVLGAPTLDSHSPSSYIQSAKPMVAIGMSHNLGFTRGSDGLVHTTLQDGPGKTVDTAPGERTHQVTRREGSIITATRLKSNKLQDGSEHTLRGNYCHEEHSNVCHRISNDNTEGDTILTVEVLPSVTTNTEVDNCDSISYFKTQRGEK